VGEEIGFTLRIAIRINVAAAHDYGSFFKQVGLSEAFLEITRSTGFSDRNVAFVTAYLDRGKQAFKKTVPQLAWNSFAWFASEPDHIVVLREGAVDQTARLSELL